MEYIGSFESHVSVEEYVHTLMNIKTEPMDVIEIDPSCFAYL